MTAEPRLASVARKLFEGARLFGLAAGQFGPPKEERVASFVYRRVAPLSAMLFAARHFEVELGVPERMTFFYNTNDWPADAPPAGWLVECPEPPRDVALRSMSGFWLLQCRDMGDARLMRGALWILHRHGYSIALDFLLDSIVSGVIVNANTARRTLMALLGARRRVTTDDHVLSYFASSVPTTLAAWTELNCDGPLPDFLHRERRSNLTDDLDLLQERFATRIDAVRAASNADEWITGRAELSRLARVIAELFQDLGLDEDLAYGAFTAQVEEIKADGGMFFLEYDDTFSDRDRAEISWVPAEAMGKMSSFYDADWLDQIMDERALVPDTLLDLYFDAPERIGERVTDPWLSPSTHLRVAFAEAVMDEPSFYPFTPVGTGFLPFPPDMLREAITALGATADDDDLAAMLDILRRGYSGEVRASDGEEMAYIGNVAVAEATAARLAAKVGVDKWRLEDWLDRAYRRACGDFALVSLRALVSREPSYFSSVEEYVTVFPNSCYGYQELAIEQDLAGKSEAAWVAIETALVLEPDNDVVWQSAAVILGRLGDHSQALVAQLMAQYLADRPPLNSA